MEETRRAYSPDDKISNEEPLLVNPTVEEPSQHLTFDLFGSAIPRGDSDKGKVSISVYNLNTRWLREQRTRVIKSVTGLLRMKDRLLKMRKKANPVEKCCLNQLLMDVRAEISDKTARPAPYAGAARAVVKNPIVFGF